MNSDTYSDKSPISIVENRDRQEINILDMLIILANRRRFIFWFTLAVAVLATIVVLLLPNRYTAEITVLPPDQNSSVGSAIANQIGGTSALASLAGSSLGIKNLSDMYVALFRSQPVEDALIQRFGLIDRYHTKRLSDARKVFEHRSTVIAGAKDGLIRITVTDRDPQLAADIANGYVDQYRKLSANLAITEAAQRRAFFQKQLLDANQNLAAAEEAMKHTQEDTGMLSLDGQTRSLIESATILRAQISAKEVELQGMDSYATSNNPQVVLARQQLVALKDQLARLSGTTGSGSDIILPKGSITQAGTEYLNKLRDVRYYETVRDLMAKEFDLASLDEAREGTLIQVVGSAKPPDKKSSPPPVVSILVSAFLGFILACAWCLVAEAVRKLKSNPVEAQRFSALREAFRR